MKKVFILAIFIIVFMVSISCTKEKELPIIIEGEKFTWNGYTIELAERSYIGYSKFFTEITDNVLTEKDQILRFKIQNRFNEAIIEYAYDKKLEVKIDDVWYEIKDYFQKEADEADIAANKVQPEETVDYTIDFADYRKLAPGEYRFLCNMRGTKDKYSESSYIYFWVVSRGETAPPEAKIFGEADERDINLSVIPRFPAMKQLTDKDYEYNLYSSMAYKLINKSGKTYYMREDEQPILEKNSNGVLEELELLFINGGNIEGWSENIETFTTDYQLPAGSYRLTIPMRADGKKMIYPYCDFEVVPEALALAPSLDKDTLEKSTADESELNTDVRINLKNNTITKTDRILESSITSEIECSTGAYYAVEAYIDDGWYEIPEMTGWVAIGIIINEGETEDTCFNYDPLGICGRLPPGRYRIVKEFNSGDYNQENWKTYFAAAEFEIK